MVKKRHSISTTFLLAAGIILASNSSASAHVGIDTRGSVATVGSSLTYEMRLGHGCTAPDGGKYGTHVFEVVVPAGAGVPTPQAIPGFVAIVTPSPVKDSAGVPVSNTVTWTAKSDNDDIQINSFAEFGIRGKPLVSGVLWFDTTQTCRIAKSVTTPAVVKKVKGKSTVVTPAKSVTTYTELYLKWTVHDSAAASVMSADGMTETGPSPSLTVAAAAVTK